MNPCRNCGHKTLMWSEDGKNYYCPNCEKSFSVDSDQVRFSPELVSALASQVAQEIKPMIEEAISKKLKPQPVMKPEKKVSPEPEKDKHKWDDD